MNNIKNIWHSMLYVLMLMLLSMSVMPADAQQEQKRISIKSFRQDRQATTAKNPKYSRTDSDGNLYAIVKVKSNSGDNLLAYTFEFGYLTHEMDGIHDDGSLWIYVKRNARHITIKREGYISVTNHDLGETIEAGGTYELRLSAQASAVKKRSLVFEVTPADVQATIKVKREEDEDYTLLGRVDANGRKSQTLETGTWLYEVTATNYQTSTGSVNLAEGSGAQRERIALLPAYGFLEVDNPAGITEAEIYVDDSFIGVTPYKSDKRWDIGEHRIVVKKGELYSDYITNFTIKAGEPTRLTPDLKANFAQTIITVDADADIYIDGERVGRRTWSGPKTAGTYTVECRQDKHRPTTRQITVRQGASETFKIDPPKPITGMLHINTDPVGAAVTINGKQMGETPFDRQMMIGQYSVTLSYSGYQPESRTIDIDDGAEEMLNIDLKEKVKPERKFGGFVEADINAGSMMGAEIGAGLRFGGVCIEVSYMLGLSKSDAVYWNYDTDTQPVECIYKPSAISLRLGYAIGKAKWSLTPQVGARILSVKSESGDSKCNATSATIGLRADYRLAKAVSVFAAPEMSFALSKSSIYEQVADVSSDVKAWGTGFNARIGLCINF